MKKLFLVALCIPLFIGCKKEETAVPADSVAPPVEATEQQAEFADAKYAEIGKKALAAMSAGDVDGWMANYADNAKYFWNAGDSLIGKPAIDKYWRDRRANMIESVSFANDIWLPVKVNKPQHNESNGVWLLGWYDVTASYKKGKEMSQSMHILYHFDENDKIDQVYHYVDRVPIMAAMPK